MSRVNPLRRSRADLLAEPLEGRALLTAFTSTSPTAPGPLPPGVSVVGGIVLDLVGANGRRVVAQLPASQLFRGFFNNGTPIDYQGNPGTIGIQRGLDPAIVDALGGGLAEAAVRLTLLDGDSAPGEFDAGDNALLLNGVPFGGFSSVPTEATSSDGATTISSNPAGGFRNDLLDTGFFHLIDPSRLTALYASLRTEGSIRYQLDDRDPNDNFLDFTAGLDPSQSGAEQPPIVVNVPPRIVSLTDSGPVSEGQEVMVQVVAIDPDGLGRPLIYRFDLDNNGTFDVSGLEPGLTTTYLASGTYRLRVQIEDADGATDDGLITVVVLNDPPRLVAPADQGAVAGASIDFALGRFLDAPSDGPWSVSLNWGDGTAIETFTTRTPGDLGSRPHAFTRDGSYVVMVQVADRTGLASTASFQVNAANVPPVVISAENQRAEEGAPALLTLGSFTDPGGTGPWAVTIDWGDGSEAEAFPVLAPGDLGTRGHVYARRGAYSVTVSVNDGQATTSGRFDVSVSNVVPSLVLPANQTAVEGTSATMLLGSFTDPGANGPWTITVNWGDGSGPATFAVPTPGDLGALGHRYAAYGTYSVTVSVNDGQATTSGRFDVSVSNVVPSLVLPANQTAVEGTSATMLLGSFTDPGANGPWMVTVSWGDGSGPATFAVPTPGDLGVLGHRYAAYGMYSVTVSVNDGQATTSGRFDVSVSNVVPSLRLPQTQDAVEGSPVAIALGSFVDPGANGPWTVTVNWGDGSAVETFTARSAADLGTREHLYARYGTYAIGVSVSDGRATRSGGFDVNVANVAPTLQPSRDQEAVEGSPALLSLGGFTDPGANGPWTVTIDWGDGSAVETFLARAPGDLVSLNHVFASGGAYSVLASISDGRAVQTGSFVVQVGSASPPLVVVDPPALVSPPPPTESATPPPAAVDGPATTILGPDLVAGTVVTVASVAGPVVTVPPTGTEQGPLGNPGLLQAVAGPSPLPAVVALVAATTVEDAPAPAPASAGDDAPASSPPPAAAAADGDVGPSVAFMATTEGPEGTDVGDNGVIAGPAVIEGGSQDGGATTTASVPAPPSPTLFGRAGGVQATIMALVVVHQRRSHTRSRRLSGRVARSFRSGT
jgi:hypothetical protein